MIEYLVVEEFSVNYNSDNQRQLSKNSHSGKTDTKKYESNEALIRSRRKSHKDDVIIVDPVEDTGNIL